MKLKEKISLIVLIILVSFIITLMALDLTGNLVTSLKSSTIVSIAGTSRGVTLSEPDYNYNIKMDDIDKSNSELTASLEVQINEFDNNHNLIKPLVITQDDIKKGDLIYYCTKLDDYGLENWFATFDKSECGDSGKDVSVEVLNLWKDPINGVYRIKYTISKIN